jgi:hypothetical protein
MEILKKWALSTLRVLNSGARATPFLQARLKNVVQRYNTRGVIYHALATILPVFVGVIWALFGRDKSRPYKIKPS